MVVRKAGRPSWAVMLLISTLMSVNIFFIHRLVEEIDDTKRMVIDLHAKVSVIEAELKRIGRYDPGPLVPVSY